MPLIVIGTLIDCAVAFGVAGVFAALVLPFASGPEAFMALPQPTPVMAIANKSAAKAKFKRRCLRGIASGRAAAQSKIASSKSPPDGEGETKAEEAAGVTVSRAVVAPFAGRVKPLSVHVIFCEAALLHPAEERVPAPVSPP